MPRPRPVILIAVLSCLVGASYLLIAILLQTGKFPVDQMLGQMPNLGDVTREDFVRATSIFAAIVGPLGLLVGVGLLAMKNWARVMARAFTVLFLLGALVNMLQAFHDGEAAGFLLYAVIGGADYAAFWYLGQARVRAAFSGAAPPAVPPTDAGPTT